MELRPHGSLQSPAIVGEGLSESHQQPAPLEARGTTAWVLGALWAVWQAVRQAVRQAQPAVTGGCHLRTWGVEGCTSKGTESRKQHVAFYNSINVALHEIKGRGRSA